MNSPFTSSSASRDTNHRFHPVLAPRLRALADDPAQAVTPEAFAGLFAPAGPPEDWDLLLDDRAIPGPGGPLPVRVYRPAADASERPCLVWMHGGAFVFGDLDMPEAHEVARGIAGRAGAVVVSVDYRLCVGGVHFPAPHDDVVAAYRWVRDHAGDLGVDPARIALGGASAGGNLAAGAALRLRDEHQTLWQVLLAYPVLHPELPEPSTELADALATMPPGLLFAPEQTRQLNAGYLGGPTETASPYAFAGLCDDLRGYPPTYIDNDEFDSLRSSGERFADQLHAAGTDVTHVTSPGVVHGHLNIVGLDVAHATLDRMAARLSKGPHPHQ
ncbi:alpha/beta hydrolase [Actinomadura sp. NTSP31]|uniref:alpha/beta hydrolase n=1 Tax=Actinomadura sp. NTSP31 TaxID=1735447 RepID=UPI0035C26E2F